MDQNNQLAQIEKQNQVNFYDEKRWTGWMKMADTFIKSGALPSTDNISTVMMKIQAGYEMGMTPLRAIKAFYFVKGVMNIYGAEVTRRFRDHGWKINYKDEANKCTATIEKGEEKYTDTLTFEDAEKSGWTKDSYKNLKPGWIEGANRNQKLRYGVLSKLIKSYVPEILGSAVDIVEVAEDTVPVIQSGTIENELDGQSIDKINSAKDLNELKNICRVILNTKGKDYQEAILKQYKIKEADFNNESN